MDIEFMIADCFESIRPKLVLFNTVEEANEAISKLEKEDPTQRKFFFLFFDFIFSVSLLAIFEEVFVPPLVFLLLTFHSF
jgi:hypothetical protein